VPQSEVVEILKTKSKVPVTIPPVAFVV